MDPAGHVFVIDGDIRQLACDAWLLPTDQRFWITSSFAEAVGMTRAGYLPSAPDSWNGRGCILHRPSTSPGQPDMWIGDIGRSGVPVDHYTARAREFVQVASAAVRARRGQEHMPLLALNVLGTGEGGLRSRRGDLLAALIPALAEAASESACDVVLVAYGSVMHAAAQAARTAVAARLGLWSDLGEQLRAVGDELALQARRGNLVVFLGAGVSAAAGVPTWRQLLEEIGARLGLDPEHLEAIRDLDPRDQATVIQRSRPEGFTDAVRRTLEADRPSLLHGLLASLPVQEFVTTNFDTLFESAAQTAGRSLAVIPGSPVSANDRWLLKLHGTLGEELVLTRGDYLGANSRHVALRGLVQAMLMTRHMLFVGYSLSDEDFHLLVHEVRSHVHAAPRRFGTALMPAPHRLLHHLWDDVDIVDTSGTQGSDPLGLDASIRRLAILVDYIGARAASTVSYIADDSLGHLRSEEESELADIVASLHRLHDRHRTATGSGWDEVGRFLALFPRSI